VAGRANGERSPWACGASPAQRLRGLPRQSEPVRLRPATVWVSRIVGSRRSRGRGGAASPTPARIAGRREPLSAIVVAILIDQSCTARVDDLDRR